jgi:polyisoprenoid-binding protein YceI
MSNLSTTTVRGYEQLTGEYVFDPAHTWIGFVARHAMVTKVRGRFTEFDGRVRIDGQEPSRSQAELTIEVASIDSRNAGRDEHLRSSDFFALDKYPHIRFASTQIEQIDEDTFRVTGDLSIKETTGPITFDLVHTGSAIDEEGYFRIGFEGSVTINRKDWGVNWNYALEAGGVLVSEKVTIELDVSAMRVD